MRIPTARYMTEDDIKIMTLKEITKKKYEAIYKGKLYCPTENCSAKVSYCSGQKAHYKTWRFSQHSPDCFYHLDRSGRRVVIGLETVISMNISKKRKQDALSRAYKSMIQMEDEMVSIQTYSDEKRNKSPKKEGIVSEQSYQMKLFGGELNEEEKYFKGKKLLTRFVDEVSPADIGHVRLIKGYVKDVELVDSVAEVIVVYRQVNMKITFEERFVKEPLNYSYLHKFWAINELLSMKDAIVFTGIGEIHEDKMGRYELSIYLGSDIRFNGEDLYNIARFMRYAEIQ